MKNKKKNKDVTLKRKQKLFRGIDFLFFFFKKKRGKSERTRKRKDRTKKKELHPK